MMWYFHNWIWALSFRGAFQHKFIFTPRIKNKMLDPDQFVLFCLLVKFGLYHCLLFLFIFHFDVFCVVFCKRKSLSSGQSIGLISLPFELALRTKKQSLVRVSSFPQTLTRVIFQNLIKTLPSIVSLPIRTDLIILTCLNWDCKLSGLQLMTVSH